MISDELKAKIRRLYHAEQWPVGTIARELTLHHSSVRRALLGDDGQDVIATHARSWDRGAQVDDLAHIEAFVERKCRARNARGLNRVFVAVPIA